MEINNETLERFITTAKTAGVPKDQLENFLKAGYVALPWQLRFHAIAREADKTGGPVQIGVGGARGPGKSHAVFAQVALDDCQRIDNLKALFLRQTGKAAQESFEDLITRILKNKVSFQYNRSSNVLTFKNGSRILLGGFENERDIDKYVGIEYDLQAIEEQNQLRIDKIEKLRGSLRTSKLNWRPRLYSSSNPGGIGHQDFKETYIIPYRDKNETTTRFIPSTYKENPYLNPEYIEYLESLTGDLGRMWREGDWDIFAGQFFAEWRLDKHVVSAFPMPGGWKKFRSIDISGRNGITSCHWYAVDYDGNVWVYREYYWGAKVKDRYGIVLGPRDADEHAEAIARLSEGESYEYTVIDNSAFSKLGLPESIAEVYERKGVTGLIPSSKDRVAGWDFMHQYLRWDDTRDPKLKIFDNCIHAIRTIPTLITDEKNPEDVDTNGEDHFADECRYFLQTLRENKTAQPMTELERKFREFKNAHNLDYSYKR